MRLLIASDIHANASALERVSQDADAVVVLGDLIDYGPDPEAAIDWVRRYAIHVVRGNHDQAVATGVRTGASEKLANAAEETAAWTRARLSADDRHYLGMLPLRVGFSFGGTSFEAVHATPTDPLYPYLPPETTAERWEAELTDVKAEWLLLGHTHLPFVRRFGDTTVLNPGSVGQPRDSLPMVSYAVWEDGDLTLFRRHYEIAETVRRLDLMDISPTTRVRLAGVLESARR